MGGAHFLNAANWLLTIIVAGRLYAKGETAADPLPADAHADPPPPHALKRVLLSSSDL